MSYDPVVREHQEWLGFLQPVGLVVSPTALKNAQARIARNVTREQEILVRHTHEAIDGNRNVRRRLNRFTEFAKEFWGWEDSDLAVPPDTVSTALQEYGEILRPDFAVPGVKSESEWQILIQELPPSHTMDQGGQTADERSWQASPQARFERLLRDTGIPIGLLVNPDAIRLVYAPRGETAGHVTFPIQAMCETAGRPMVAALHLLLDAQRLFALPKDQRLPAILQASRKYQNEVSIQLAGQVLRALNELCRGFNEANRESIKSSCGDFLQEMIREAPDEIYGGLLTTLMRMVFLLYAEDRNLMASDEAYQRCYGLIGLHEKLREDAAAYPDTMDQRLGAWAQLLTLSRLVHDGGGHGHWRIPARRGRLFDPDCYPFLEGRPYKSKRSHDEKLTPPKVYDGVLYRVLEDLLYLDGERISYRALDVEQIGSVYEAMMGFTVEVAGGPSVGFKPDHVVINLQTLLEQAPGDRKKWLKENAGWELAEKAAQALKVADSVEAILGALNSRVSPLYADRERGTLRIAPGDIYLQPTEERRRSGSHYTPRTLTEPIVRTTLDPVLKQLGEDPTPHQILNLKVCDPAMGSGAFLVEACRYLGDALVKAWAAHKTTPDIPADQDPLLHARRIVAQRCLYGVDKNPFAVDLAKLSLWLATFAKDHPFTFLDHSFRHGDSLVGLDFNQIVDALGDGSTLFRPLAEARVKRAMEARRSILDSAEHTPYALLETKYELARQSVGTLRDLGDAVVAAFFLENKSKDRARRRSELVAAFDREQFDVVAGAIHALRNSNHGLTPFHWQTEFPEVFDGGGFHAVVGNPPFLGGTRISEELGMNYFAWLTSSYPPAGHLCDLIAYFFRRSFQNLRVRGCMGLIATNTVAQGDTREGGLEYIALEGGQIYSAFRRLRWPGQAAVVVSAVHITKEGRIIPARLNGVTVDRISAFLLGGRVDTSPTRLLSSPYFSAGSKIYGQGFVFDDSDPKANPMALRLRVLDEYPKCESRILPYIGGEELNSHPSQHPHRYVIFLSDIKTEGDLESQWPALARIVREKVKPERDRLGDNPNNTPLRNRWWAYQAHRPELYERMLKHARVLANSQVSGHLSFAFLSTDWLYAHTLNLFELEDFSAFAVLQSRIHEVWARLLGSSMKDDLRYTASDCFETFPFPRDWKANETLERIGEEYYQFRAGLMIRNNEGLTRTYNRFHDKYEDNTDIQKVRELHARLDRAVLDAYGWTELVPAHDFILDYEEPEEDENGGRRKRREPWRYRWTDEFRDDVLARLLDLNRERAEEEKKVAAATQLVIEATKATTKRDRKKKDEQTAAMFTEETE